MTQCMYSVAQVNAIESLFIRICCFQHRYVLCGLNPLVLQYDMRKYLVDTVAILTLTLHSDDNMLWVHVYAVMVQNILLYVCATVLLFLSLC